MFDAFKKLGLARAFLGHPPAPSTVDEDSDLDVDQLVGGLRRGGALPIASSLDIDFVMNHPGVTELYNTRYLPEPASIRELERFGDGTLGREYARFLRWSGWRPVNIPPGFQFEDRVLYIRTRTQMTHGLLHLVTEYDLTELGELALQAFLLAQTANKQSALLVSSGLVRVLGRSPERVGELLGLVAEAHERGRVSRHYMSMAWEELWSAPLDQVRELVGLTPRASDLAQLDFRLAPDAAPTLVLGPPEPLGAEAPREPARAPTPSREPEPPRPRSSRPQPTRDVTRTPSIPSIAELAAPVSAELADDLADDPLRALLGDPPPEPTRQPAPEPTRQPAPEPTRQPSRETPRAAPTPTPSRPRGRRPPPPPPRPEPRRAQVERPALSHPEPDVPTRPRRVQPRRAPPPEPVPPPQELQPEPKPRLQTTEEIKNLPPGRHFIESVEPDEGYPDEGDPDFF
ncbi:MAG: hypothetical protein H6713_33290 [Myxococcales bacterium]|nr:hypothetical protein [Myxococcales bacterium]